MYTRQAGGRRIIPLNFPAVTAFVVPTIVKMTATREAPSAPYQKTQTFSEAIKYQIQQEQHTNEAVIDRQQS